MHEDTRLQQAKKIYIGAKQTKKAIEKNEATLVYMARDAESRVIDPLIALCKEKDIEIVYVASMQELGRLCGIEVGSTSAAIIQ